MITVLIICFVLFCISVINIFLLIIDSYLIAKIHSQRIDFKIREFLENAFISSLPLANIPAFIMLLIDVLCNAFTFLLKDRFDSILNDIEKKINNFLKSRGE